MSVFRHGEKRPRDGTSALTKFFVFIFLSTLATVCFSVWWYSSSLSPVNSGDESSEVFTVEDGATAAELSYQLENRGLIKSALAYRIYLKIDRSKTNLQAGSYTLSTNMSTQEIASKISNGDVTVSLFTILPSQRIDQIQAAFMDLGFTQDEVDSAFDPRNYEDLPVLIDKPPLASLEGYLYPESFQMSDDTEIKTVINASLELMNRNISAQLRQDLLNNHGLNIHEAITLASIVEREVGNSADRNQVAQVFLKRYREGISLGSDVTAFYGAILYGLDLSVYSDTPYNTRLHLGLPPGPISNVGLESLRAIAYPANTDYLFFVSGDDGTTYFSNTLQEHEALTAQYCIELCGG